MPSRTQVGDEYDSAEVAQLVHGGDDSRDGRGNLIALLNRRDHRVEISGGKCLLEGYQQREQENEHLKGTDENVAFSRTNDKCLLNSKLRHWGEKRSALP